MKMESLNSTSERFSNQVDITQVAVSELRQQMSTGVPSSTFQSAAATGGTTNPQHHPQMSSTVTVDGSVPTRQQMPSAPSSTFQSEAATVDTTSARFRQQMPSVASSTFTNPGLVPSRQQMASVPSSTFKSIHPSATTSVPRYKLLSAPSGTFTSTRAQAPSTPSSTFQKTDIASSRRSPIPSAPSSFFNFFFRRMFVASDTGSNALSRGNTSGADTFTAPNPDHNSQNTHGVFDNRQVSANDSLSVKHVIGDDELKRRTSLFQSNNFQFGCRIVFCIGVTVLFFFGGVALIYLLLADNSDDSDD